ncbi:hypothetical protein DL766_003260 [Monosporascus sp. MC13-8B]|uniref:Uncharacterized protein n=1 Tax=Monosporascus cannonballus TaxID=155416 RepID=A0ABY0HB66_9PEZI|nr:hypothetical protein DL762_003223 [Monosporascus cannonballus]RYP00824.1 hypothetical protein DL763_000549 [Monosporascus cannonballus]RYP33819.1 hypothetical protein DL766_003260 [Monosporascus sp. MC13-8B]
MPSQMVKATLAATALASASNILAQFLESYRDKQPFVFNPAGFLRFVLVAFITAPPNYQWQQLLERSFPAYELKAPVSDAEKQQQMSESAGAREQKPKLNLRNTMAKWFIDCITLGAIFNTVAFLVLMGILKRQPMGQIGHNIRTETIPIIVAGYKIWPFASIVSFSCVPVEKRIVFLNFVGLIWGIYMSLVGARI